VKVDNLTIRLVFHFLAPGTENDYFPRTWSEVETHAWIKKTEMLGYRGKPSQTLGANYT